MRLFYALTLDKASLQSLWGWEEALRLSCAKGNFTRRENLHLTLAFLGEVEPGRLPALKVIVEELPRSPVAIPVTRLGTFSGGLIWAGGQTPPEAEALHRELLRRLTSGGWDLSGERFTPHFTLARRAELLPGKTLREVEASLRSFMAKTAGVKLMLSHRVEGILTYTPL